MKKFRDYLEIGSKITGIPGQEKYYDRLKENVKRYLDRTWAIVANLVLASRSVSIMIRIGLRSPIEQLMYLGLLRVFLVDFLNYPNDCVFFFLWLHKFIIGAERRVRYSASCIIECDGHDFHEKTKEQARKDKSKDRTLEERGLHVIRFTGSEITKDPEVCALQVKDYINSKVDKIARIIEKEY